MKSQGMSNFTIELFMPGKRESISLSWPLNTPLPRFGETFKYENVHWLIEDTVWDYEGNALTPMKVTYKMFLGEDMECDCDEDEDF